MSSVAVQRYLKPLLIAAAVIGLLFWLVSAYGNDFLIWVVSTQQQLHQLLREHVALVAQDPWQQGMGLILAAFAYGIFHAIGPGHGKAIITSYLGTQQGAGMRQGLWLSMLGALFQSMVAILVVSFFALILKVSLGRINQHEWVLETVSYGLLMVLGVVIIARVLWQWWRSRQAEHAPAPDLAGASDFTPISETEGHQHSADCGCSHHVIVAETVTLREQLLLIASMGFRPCTGALLVLVYAHLVQVYLFGVVAVLAMGLGTGMAVALLAVVVVHFRQRILRWSQGQSSGGRQWNISLIVKLAGGLLLLLLGLSLLLAVNMAPASHPIL